MEGQRGRGEEALRDEEVNGDGKQPREEEREGNEEGHVVE